MAIKLNTRVFNAIHQVLSSRIFEEADLKKPNLMVMTLLLAKEDEAADWVRNHNAEYVAGILQGFEIDNSQDAQLFDIHRN